MSTTESLHPGEVAARRLSHLRPGTPNLSLINRNLVTLATLKDQPDLPERVRSEKYDSMAEAYQIAAWRLGSCIKSTYIGRLSEGRLNAIVLPPKNDGSSDVLSARFCTNTSADGIIFSYAADAAGTVTWAANYDWLKHSQGFDTIPGSTAEITVPPIYAVMALRAVSSMVEYVPNNVIWAGGPKTAEL